jgi:hypothetical protein
LCSCCTNRFERFAFFHATWNLFRHLPLVDIAAVCERVGRKSIDHGKKSRLQDGLVKFWLYTHLGHASGDWRSLLLLLRVFRKSLWAICFPCRNETCSALTCVKTLWFSDTELDQVSHGLWLGAFFLQFWKKYCITGLTSLRFSRRQKASRNLCAPPGDSKSKSSGDQM